MSREHPILVRFLAFSLIFLSSVGCSRFSVLLFGEPPSIEISKPSAKYANERTTVSYLVTYKGYQDVHLSASDIQLKGAAASSFANSGALAVPTCDVAVTDVTDLVKKVEISNCQGNAPVGFQIGPGTATISESMQRSERRRRLYNAAGDPEDMSAPAVDLSSDDEFYADNVASQIRFANLGEVIDLATVRGKIEIPLYIPVLHKN